MYVYYVCWIIVVVYVWIIFVDKFDVFFVEVCWSLRKDKNLLFNLRSLFIDDIIIIFFIFIIYIINIFDLLNINIWVRKIILKFGKVGVDFRILEWFDYYYIDCLNSIIC